MGSNQQIPRRVERFRGSSEIPLTDQGVQAAHQLAMHLATRGGLDEIHTSSLGRTVHTARILSQYTHAPIVDTTSSLHPWHLGGLEGREITPELLAHQKALVLDHPDEVPPGRGPLSTSNGESFNSFKTRTLGKLNQLMSHSAADPSRVIAAVTHYRVKKLVDAWLRRGADPSGDIDTHEMTTHSGQEQPGSLDHLVMDPYAGPQMFSVDPSKGGRLQGGIYLVRHEATPWNLTEGS